MIRSTDPTDQDQQVLRKAALKIALRISAVCALLVLCLLAAATLYLLNQAGHPEPIETGAVYAYLDTNDLVEAMIIAGVAGTLLAGGIGWLSARSAIRPSAKRWPCSDAYQGTSHEMRTPLAILDARIQLAQRTTNRTHPPARHWPGSGPTPPPSHLIVNELLESATGTPHQPNGSPADVAGVAKDVMDNIRPLAAKRGTTLEYRQRATAG